LIELGNHNSRRL